MLSHAVEKISGTKCMTQVEEREDKRLHLDRGKRTGKWHHFRVSPKEDGREDERGRLMIDSPRVIGPPHFRCATSNDKQRQRLVSGSRATIAVEGEQLLTDEGLQLVTEEEERLLAGVGAMVSRGRGGAASRRCGGCGQSG
ncbi:hypothetical protein BHE74_00037856 [Ensete ventricosum]|nr:hypothetical protein BHE74_00037856 [Ensete ventricosum]